MSASITQETAPDLKHGQEVLQDITPSKGNDEREEALDQSVLDYIPDTDAEKKLVRKVDLFMVPMLWWMCILCYVDRNNIVSCPKTYQRLYKGLTSV
jgi:hypothetical protein